MWNDARLELSAQDGLEEVPVIETTQETAMQGIQCYTPGFASGDIFASPQETIQEVPRKELVY